MGNREERGVILFIGLIVYARTAVVNKAGLRYDYCNAGK
jgi:hypothetical protein